LLYSYFPHPLYLKSAFHVPSLKQNLISITHLYCDNSCKVLFYDTSVSIQGKTTGIVLLRVASNGDLRPIHLPLPSPSLLANVSIHQPAQVWHRRLGHPSFRVLATLCSNKLISFTSKLFQKCVSCCLGKSTKLPFQEAKHFANKPLFLIHSDVWQSPIPSSHGCRYYIIFVDDFSHFVWIYPMIFKSEAFAIFCAFYKMVDNLLNTKTKFF